MMFSFDKPRDPSGICDIVRAMVTTNSMGGVTKIAMALLEMDEVQIVRVKDRFVSNPSAGGWRDLMVNFYLMKDPNRHICEVQVSEEQA